MTIDGARLERTEYGMVAATAGWFAVNVREAAWVTSEKFGDACIFEGDAVIFMAGARAHRGSGTYTRSRV